MHENSEINITILLTILQKRMHNIKIRQILYCILIVFYFKKSKKFTKVN